MFCSLTVYLHAFIHTLPISYKERGEYNMLGWSVTFFIIALVAAVLGFTGVAGAAVGIAKILAVVFLVLFILSLISTIITGRHTTPPSAS